MRPTRTPRAAAPFSIPSKSKWRGRCATRRSISGWAKPTWWSSAPTNLAGQPPAARFVVELGANEPRRPTSGRKVWSSAPVRVLAVVFHPRIADARIREALALAVDRTAIYNVLLQRQGEISGALLPQWLSGYAFLFPTTIDLARARALASDAPASARR